MLGEGRSLGLEGSTAVACARRGACGAEDLSRLLTAN